MSLDLTKWENPTTGTVHLSVFDFTAEPICREMSFESKRKLVRVDDKKCICKNCLRRLDDMLYHHMYELQMNEHRAEIFVPFDEQQHTLMPGDRRPACPEGLALYAPVGVSVHGRIPL